MGPRGAADQVRPGEIGVDDVAPFLRLGFGKRGAQEADSSVIDQDIQATTPIEHALHGLLNGIFAAHVHVHSEGAGFVRRGGERGLVSTTYRHPCPAIDEFFGNRAPDALSAARHERNLT